MEFKTSKESAVCSLGKLVPDILLADVFLRSSPLSEVLHLVCNGSLAHGFVVLGSMLPGGSHPFFRGDGAGVVSVDSFPGLLELFKSSSALGRNKFG